MPKSSGQEDSEASSVLCWTGSMIPAVLTAFVLVLTVQDCNPSASDCPCEESSW